MRIKKLFLGIILSFLSLNIVSAYSELYLSLDKAYFIDEPINCREEPTKDSKVLGKFYIGDCVKIVEFIKGDIIDNISSSWGKVEGVNKKLSGYVFLGYNAGVGFKAKLGSAFGDNRDYFVASRSFCRKMEMYTNIDELYVFSPEKKRIQFANPSKEYGQIYFAVSKDKKKTILFCIDMNRSNYLMPGDEVREDWKNNYVFDVYELTSRKLTYIESFEKSIKPQDIIFFSKALSPDKSVIKKHLGDCDYDVYFEK